MISDGPITRGTLIDRILQHQKSKLDCVLFMCPINNNKDNNNGIIEVKEIFTVVKSERERERERERESIITNRQNIFTIFNVDIAPAL